MTQTASNYGTVLFELGVKKEIVEKTKEIFSLTEELPKMLQSPIVSKDAKQVEQMKAYLANKYGKQTVELSMVEDKSLIGGFVLRVGDKEEDYSMKGRLDRLEKRLTWR